MASEKDPNGTRAALPLLVQEIRRLRAQVSDLEALVTAENQRKQQLEGALVDALNAVDGDRCDGESCFSDGVNAACRRHAAMIRIIAKKAGVPV